LITDRYWRSSGAHLRGAEIAIELSSPDVARNLLHMQWLSLRSNMLEEQAMAKRRKRRYSRGAGSEVKREMHRYKRGSARSGRGGRGGKVKSRKQAIAIGLSKARKKGKKVPKKRA
jgi:hypothetical protein